ncbi:uncharacterized protein [Bombus flavifrons]|uniref:uncharacterized protein n=1 Tax=Bombus flavifrons TaxID=103934 RepID=UPI003703B9BF
MVTVEFSSSRLTSSKELRARSFSVYSSSLAPVSPLDGSLVIATWSCRDRSVVHPITGREGTSTTWCFEPEISEEDHSELVLLGKRPASQIGEEALRSRRVRELRQRSNYLSVKWNSSLRSFIKTFTIGFERPVDKSRKQYRRAIVSACNDETTFHEESVGTKGRASNNKIIGNSSTPSLIMFHISASLRERRSSNGVQAEREQSETERRWRKGTVEDKRIG